MMGSFAGELCVLGGRRRRAAGEKQSGVEMQGREKGSCRIGGWDTLWRR